MIGGGALSTKIIRAGNRYSSILYVASRNNNLTYRRFKYLKIPRFLRSASGAFASDHELIVFSKILTTSFEFCYITCRNLSGACAACRTLWIPPRMLTTTVLIVSVISEPTTDKPLKQLHTTLQHPTLRTAGNCKSRIETIVLYLSVCLQTSCFKIQRRNQRK